MHWDSHYAYWFDQDNGRHLVLDASTGKLLRTQSLTQSSTIADGNAASGKYVLEPGIDLSKREDGVFKVFPAWFTNIPVGGWDYFLCFTDPGSKTGPPYCVGRVNIATGKVEYLELPVQVRAGRRRCRIGSSGISHRRHRPWTHAVSMPPAILAPQRDGWYWNFLGAPTAVNGHIYFTTMLGVTYVIDGDAPILNESACLAVNDLGTAGKTWSLNSVSYSQGACTIAACERSFVLGKRSISRAHGNREIMDLKFAQTMLFVTAMMAAGVFGSVRPVGAQGPDGDLAPIPLKLPKPAFIGTPADAASGKIATASRQATCNAACAQRCGQSCAAQEGHVQRATV